MRSCLAVQPARQCPKCTFKCLCPDPSCSLQDKLPPLLSVQARALTLQQDDKPLSGGYSLTRDSPAPPPTPQPSRSYPVTPLPRPRFDLPIRRGKSTAEHPPLHPPNPLTLHGAVSYEVVIKAIVLHQSKREEGVRDTEGSRRGKEQRYEERGGFC